MNDSAGDAMFVIFLFMAIICGSIAVLGYLTEVLPLQIQRIRRRVHGHTKRSGRYRERPAYGAVSERRAEHANDDVFRPTKENA